MTNPVLFGEVLFDCFPNGETVLGGAPFNIAWHLKGFGENPFFMSRIGKDERGDAILTAMRQWGMQTEGLQRDLSYPTGHVQVSVVNDQPYYEIAPDQAWDMMTYPKVLADDNFLLYHGTLALRGERTRAVCQGLRGKIRGPLFLDINLRPPWWVKDCVLTFLEGVNWLKLNEEELNALNLCQGSLEKKIDVLRSLCETANLILTRGEKGAIAFMQNGAQFRVEPTKTSEIVDTVGAGDAFSSVLILGVLKNWDIELSLQRAQTFASEILKQSGATSANMQLYSNMKKKWGLV